jgi:hypothetical protein
MGKLIITYKGNQYEYLINTAVPDHVSMQAIEHILKWFPKDAPVDFIELY